MSNEFLGGFSKFFTNLTKAQRQELDRALADLQNSKEITSLDESLRLLKRKPDQRLPIPVLSVTETVLGAIIEWEPLSDQRINFYEANVSTFSNFSSFTTVTTFGHNLVLDGLNSTKYVRVRGVRRDGTTTPFSDVASVVPSSFVIRSHTAEAFYIPLEGTATHTIIGGADTTLEYTPANADGNSMVWGFFTAYADPACAMFGSGEIQASVWVTITDGNGNTTSDTEYLRFTLGEHYNSMNIGPFHIPHPTSGSSVTIRVDAWDITTKENGLQRKQDATNIEWIHLNVLEVGTA